MPYKLLLSEEITPAVRRMIVEQLTRARRELSSTQNIQEGVHKSRSCLKRVRSLLRLARPILGENIFYKENKVHRNIARALARPREAGALFETIVKLETRDDFKKYSPLIKRLKQIIEQKKLKIESELEIVSLASLVEELDASILRWKSMPLGQASFDSLAHGFGSTYDRGRRSLKTAIKRDENYYLHEWRKDVQQTWRHLQILTLIWPDDIMPRIKLAREISRLLGTENDISDLEIFMKANKKKILKTKGAHSLYKPFRSSLRTIRRDLSLHAVERGRRLYAFEAAAITDAMTIYWRTSKALQPMPNVALELAEVDHSKQSTAPFKKETPKKSALERMREATAARQSPSSLEETPRPSVTRTQAKPTQKKSRATPQKRITDPKKS